MILNSTIFTVHHHHHHHSLESVEEPTAINELAPREYDSAGAALFITVVLLWYALSITCMIGIQIRARAETIEDCARRRAKLFIRTLRDQTQTKQILEDLADKQKRDKLWQIYWGTTDTNKEKLKRAEIRRIRNIKKQLAAINRNRIIMNDTILTPVMKTVVRRMSCEFQSTSIPNLSAVGNLSCIRRRSSLDQQIIERWKSAVDESKGHEQLPWTIRKRLITRQFRRYCKNRSNSSEQLDTPRIDSLTIDDQVESVDDEQCQLLSSDKQMNNLRRRSKETNDRLNPYMTYFHLPINGNFQAINQNIPLVTVKSNHQIIQLHLDESQC